MPSICEALHKFNLFYYFDKWLQNSIFPICTTWKLIFKRKIKDHEENALLSFVSDHPNFQMARSCLANVSPEKFWAITTEFPDLVCRASCSDQNDGLARLNIGTLSIIISYHLCPIDQVRMTFLYLGGFKSQNFFGPSRGSGGMLSRKSLKIEPFRLAKDAFPANV